MTDDASHHAGPARPIARTATTILTTLALSACGLPNCEPSTDRGAVDRTVTVTRAGEPIGVTATVTAWNIAIHPQTGDDIVHIDFHFEQDREFVTQTTVKVYVCAVDDHRRVVDCTTAAGHASMLPIDAGTWIVTPDTAKVVDVLLIADDVSPAVHPCSDIKDGDDYVPPRVPLPGDAI